LSKEFFVAVIENSFLSLFVTNTLDVLVVPVVDEQPAVTPITSTSVAIIDNTFFVFMLPLVNSFV
jgi:hypothetical protein